MGVLWENTSAILGFYAQIVQKFNRTQFGEAGAKISLKIFESITPLLNHHYLRMYKGLLGNP